MNHVLNWLMGQSWGSTFLPWRIDPLKIWINLWQGTKAPNGPTYQPWTKFSHASSSGTVLVILEASMADCDEHQLRIKQYRLSIAGAVSAKRVTCPGVVLWWFARLWTCQIAGRSRLWKRVWKLCWKLASDQHGSIWMMMLDVPLSVFLGCASRSSMQWAEDVATRFFSDELCRHAHRHLLRVCTWSFVGALSIYWVGCCHSSRRRPLSPCIVVGTKLHQQQQIQCLLTRAPRWPPCCHIL